MSEEVLEKVIKEKEENLKNKSKRMDFDQTAKKKMKKDRKILGKLDVGLCYNDIYDY